jgi:PKD domain/Secretion system C-terminal sorting domain
MSILLYMGLLLGYKKTKGQCIVPNQYNICVSANNTFNVFAAQPNWIYTWSVTNNNLQLANVTGTSNTILSNIVSDYTITVNGASTTSTATSICTQVIHVMPNPEPIIAFASSNICQGNLPAENGGGPNILDDGTCIKVCEGSTIRYTAISASSGTSTFTWAVVGGSVMGSGNNVDEDILWDNSIGNGSIVLTETSQYGCITSKTLCIERILKPIASIVHNLGLPNGNGCYEICTGQQVLLTDPTSTIVNNPNVNSPVIAYNWDFGDGTFSNLQTPPVHNYNSPGTYTVTYFCTNACNCVSTYTMCIDVQAATGPIIMCNKVTCQDNFEHYSTNATCTPYNWSVLGGHIYIGGVSVGNTYQGVNTTDNEIVVLWDDFCVTDGFGLVTLDGSTCGTGCNSPFTIKVPIIAKSSCISWDLHESACQNSIVKFNLPAWPATDFNWSFNFLQGISTISSQFFVAPTKNGNTIKINTGPNSGTFMVRCEYINTITNCSGFWDFVVDVFEKPTLQAVKKICKGQNVHVDLITANPTSNTNDIIWTATEANGAINATVTIAANGLSLNTQIFNFANPGVYKISATSINNNNISSHPFDFCEPDPINIEVLEVPVMPNAITGADIICPGFPYTYIAHNTIPGTIFNWQTAPLNTDVPLPASGLNGDLIGLNWNAAPNPRILELRREWAEVPGCLSGAVTLAISNKLTVGTLTGSIAPHTEDCASTFTLSGVDPDFIEWSFVTASAGSITAGQGTKVVSVLWNHLTGGTITTNVKCKYTICGVPYTTLLLVTISKAPAISSITGNVTVCGGITTNTFIFNANTAYGTPTKYEINWGDITEQVISTAYTISKTHIYINNTSAPISFIISARVHSGCSNTWSAAKTFTITVNPSPAFNFTGASSIDYGNCGVLPPFSSTLSVAISNGGSPYNYIWSGLASGSGSGVGTVGSVPCNNFLGVGLYSLSITNVWGCTAAHDLAISSGCYNGGCPTSCYYDQVSSTGNCNTLITSVSLTQPNNCVPINTTWSIIPSAGVIPSSGTGLTTGSVVFTNPGPYTIIFKGDFPSQNGYCQNTMQKAISPGNIPVIGYKFACNGTNNGYNIIATDNSTVTGVAPTDRKWILDNNVLYSSIIDPNVITINGLLPGSVHQLKLGVSYTSGAMCYSDVTVAVPNLPQATYSITTQDPLSTSTALSSCEDQKVYFIWTGSSPTFSNLYSSKWTFGDGTESWIWPNTNRVYKYNSSGFNSNSTKFYIKDIFGCDASKNIIINILENSMVAPTSNTYALSPNNMPICGGQPVAITCNVTGGNTPLSFNWFTENTYLPSLPQSNPTTVTNVNKGSGTYWAKVTDAHNCFKNVNPGLATLTFKQEPNISIIGAQDVCYNAPILLQAMANQVEATITYNWTRQPGNITFSTKAITDMVPLAGTYTYSVIATISYTGGMQCTKILPKYIVTSHAPPTVPVITATTNCAPSYNVDLVATASGNFTYNWSTGTANGNTTNVSYGGIFRCRITDQYGCQSYADITVQDPPDADFWRLPTGCAVFCEQNLPVQVNPNINTKFEDWAWYFNGALAPLNGAYNTMGQGYCDPLVIDNMPPMGSGNGSGLYSWNVKINGCKATSPEWDVSIVPCAPSNANAENFGCVFSNIGGNMELNVLYDNQICAPGYLNAWIVDANNNILESAIINTPVINLGLNNLTLAFSTLDVYAGQNATIILEMVCGGGTSVNLYAVIIPDGCGHKLSGSKGAKYFNPKQFKFEAVPNPANNKVCISYSLDNTIVGNNTLSIIDALGRIVFTQDIAANSHIINLDTDSYRNGLYTILLRQNGGLLAVQKLLIQH